MLIYNHAPYTPAAPRPVPFPLFRAGPFDDQRHVLTEGRVWHLNRLGFPRTRGGSGWEEHQALPYQDPE